ncbi:MAG TPA: hypothetical protein VEK11_18860, partial [Thermoanaerobaculia bacterium]|nr:hypothetical protein [Thermoanaerobaculia bacterium]
ATFHARTVCISNGVLTSKRPRNARNVDLAGAYVVPPFGEAHNHNVEESPRRVVPEVTALRELGIFSDAELLDLWSRVTPRAIFPKRKIGCLDDGCEASFLALEGDPLLDFAHTGRIRLRVKDGKLLELAPTPVPSRP